MQNVKPRKYRSDGGLHAEIKSHLNILKDKRVVLMLSPIPSGKKSWMLHLIMDILNIDHQCLEDRFYIENFFGLLDNFDYVVLGEVDIDNIIQFAEQISVPEEIMERIRFPLATLYYSECFEAIRVFGSNYEPVDFIDLIVKKFSGFSVVISGDLTLPNNHVYSSIDKILLPRSSSLVVFSNFGVNVEKVKSKFNLIVQIFFDVHEDLFTIGEVYYMRRGQKIYEITFSEEQVYSDLLDSV